jgi:hypothetical protein
MPFLPRVTSVLKGEAESGKQSFALIIRFCRCRDADVETANGIHLVILDFRENDLFFYANVVVATTVK